MPTWYSLSVLLALLALLAADLPARVEARLVAAEEAIARGDESAAGGELALAWAYASPVFAKAWREQPAARDAFLARHELGRRRVQALRRYPRLAGVRALARTALADADAQARPVPEPYDPAIAAAAACLTAADAALPEVDPDHVISGANESIAALRADCDKLAADAAAGRERAAKAADARRAALRALLKKDRLIVFDAHGEPECDCGDHDPATVARAKLWIYRSGPTGALETYETLTFTFRGDTLVGQTQRVGHEAP
jgi:hypothetical protein